MGSISITFTGATMEEVVRLVAAWTPPSRGALASGAPAAPSLPADDTTVIGQVLQGVHGQKSRRLLRLLAEAGLTGADVQLSASLIRDFGVTSGTAFAGMIGPVNRRANALMGRSLIDYPSADPKDRIWRIAPPDAAAVLACLDAR